MGMITNFLVLLNFLLLAASATNTDYILWNCGSDTTSTSTDSRVWQPETISTNSPSSQTSRALNQSSLVPQIPYMTARIFNSQFTYSFPSLSPGPKFLRLYFYPATYNPNFNKTSSFFSVIANQNTLLTNFSAFLTVSSVKNTSQTLIKEYIIHINHTQPHLNLTFSPNPSSYAFINGIEIVSIPDDLYFKGDQVPIQTNEDNSYFLKNITALETLYRLNVGSVDVVPAIGDTGSMFRQWSPDDDYVYPSGMNQSRNVTVSYTPSDPPYTAPETVYLSARFQDENFSTISNLTWSFKVDFRFQYLLRLHFCEFFWEIRNPGDRVFSIFINNKIVVRDADVIDWANGPQKAVSRDYVAYGQMNEQELLLTMKPSELPSRYENALLNGLEIFKISDSSGSLSSPNPDLPPDSSTPLKQGQAASGDKKNTKPWGLIGGIVGGVALVAAIIGVLIFRRWKSPKRSATTSVDDIDSKGKSRSTRTSISGGGSSLPLDLCRYFSLEEIIKGTHNFDDNFLIGVGGFGNVYKGRIDNGGTEVAIKRLNKSSNQGELEFSTEIEMLSKLRHVNVVSLIGYCDENGEMILVYDYMSRGTLRDHLNNSGNLSLTWKQRLQICIGSAKGLHYLHTSAKYSIIHRDVKSTNILLDDKWVAKVSDFGLSKVGPMAGVDTHVSTMVKGSFGYMDPEYYKRQHLTEKSDVYSFGVVLFEVLCSRPAIIHHVPKEQVNLANWVRFCIKKDNLYKIIDPVLKDEIAVESLNKYVEIGLRCLKDTGVERPAMSDVVWTLKFALQLQEAAEKRMKPINEEGYNGNEDDKTNARLGLHGEAPTTDDDNNDMFSMSMEASSASYSKSKSSGYFSGSGDGLKAQSVFSEIIQPSAR